MQLPRERTLAAVGKIRNDCIGSRKIDARPELYPGGIVAMRERWR